MQNNVINKGTRKIMQLLAITEKGGSLTLEEQRLLENTSSLCWDSVHDGMIDFRFLAGISRLHALKELTLRSDSLDMLPNSIGSLNKLERLVLHCECLTVNALPDSIRHLHQLNELTIYSKHFSSLPDILFELIQLRQLIISRTPLEVLPSWISKWENLELLDLSWTNLRHLPPEIGQLKRLKHLNLTGLVLCYIPSTLVDLNLPFYFEKYDCKRSGICLHDTKLTMQPIDLFRLSHEQLLQHYAIEHRQINEAKVIFLGDGSVGKTYTISRILNDCKPETPAHPYPTTVTHGIMIKPHHTERDGQSYDIRFWDFGGQDIMHSIHRCFLTKRTCYVIIISTRTPDQTTSRATYWLHTVDHFASGTPVILAINYWGVRNSRTGLDETKLRLSFPNIADIVYYSAKSSSEAEFRRLEDAIITQSRQLDCHNMILPVTWDNVRQELLNQASKSIYHIDRDMYHIICDKQGLEQEQTIRAWLLDWFNDLGICFSYHLDHQRQELEDYKVLNPQWLTSAVYKIIFGKGITQKGLISLSEVQRILGNSDDSSSIKKGIPCLKGVSYTENECYYVLEVMRKFKVSYPASDTEEFIPALLSDKMPKGMAPKPGKIRIAYKLVYSFLPESIVHQLMIYSFNNLAPGKCWRKGLYLNFKELEGIEALVQMENGNCLDDCELHIDLYASHRDFIPKLMQLLIKRIRFINSEMNLLAEEYVCAEQNSCREWISVNRICKLFQRGENYVQGIDTNYDIQFILETFGISTSPTENEQLK